MASRGSRALLAARRSRAGKTLSSPLERRRAAEAALSGEDRGKRWLIAGAARRGRAGKHWSTRQR